MTSRSEPRPAASGVGYNLGLIAMTMALVGVGAAYALDSIARPMEPLPALTTTEPTLTRALGGRNLEIPLSWFRFGEQRVEGFADQIDLSVPMPLADGGRIATIDVTLMPRSRARPSAGLLDGVYLHNFEPVEISGPPGLVGKPLRAREGFSGETVWYDALSPEPFVAKCMEPVTDGAPSRCLRTVVLSPGIAALYSFDASVLPAWRRFDAEITPWLSRIGAF
ncbi:hypothetical protein EMQ25_07975 [Arsenicitalea aurantiaca]|uniref:Uncharacterized protein n=1 Tax=Arsenicitalea aurantiaca TaxID=1783274 RepID=A0A433XG89_9HYPH|nr:hypothetical protein [Arsenicitalea aurantiaca]RUT33052.1 hypothetical protein EMQ25_07975 [Arsenicitalea aurantiaca]